MKDLVSVIIPTYNREEFVGECIDSVLAQSYQNFEIILIDDGSIDKTVEVCENYAARDSRIKLICAEHGGVSAARNKGLDAAEGEYVFFVDSDDMIHPCLLETFVKGLVSSNASIAGTTAMAVPEKNWYRVKKAIEQDEASAEILYKTNAETIAAFFKGLSPFGVIGGTMMRRDLIGDTRFNTELSIGEDFYFIYENIIKGASSCFLDKKWDYCRLHDRNSSWDYSYKGFWSRFYRRELVWKSEEALGRKEYVDRQKRDAFGCFVRCFFKNEPCGADGKKMRAILKEYKNSLFPVLGFNHKFLYIMCLYFPRITSLLYKSKNKKNFSASPKKQIPKIVRDEILVENAHIELLSGFLNMSLHSGDEIFERFAALPNAVSDSGKLPLQRYVYIPGSKKDRVVLVAHMDTVWDEYYSNAFSGERDIEFEDGVFYSTNPQCGIGADDRAGCAMLYELRDSGHSLLILDGEEHGKIGAKYFKKSNPKLFREINRHCFMLELDWCGTNRCLYNQVDSTDEFKEYISKSIGFEDDMKKGGCDLQIICRDICGANLGVGYHFFHTASETLDVYEWENTLCKLREFLALPQKRYKCKIYPRYVRLVKRVVGKVLRMLKLKGR